MIAVAAGFRQKVLMKIALMKMICVPMRGMTMFLTRAMMRGMMTIQTRASASFICASLTELHLLSRPNLEVVVGCWIVVGNLERLVYQVVRWVLTIPTFTSEPPLATWRNHPHPLHDFPRQLLHGESFTYLTRHPYNHVSSMMNHHRYLDDCSESSSCNKTIFESFCMSIPKMKL